jgi:hypothetical protein
VWKVKIEKSGQRGADVEKRVEYGRMADSRGSWPDWRGLVQVQNGPGNEFITYFGGEKGSQVPNIVLLSVHVSASIE